MLPRQDLDSTGEPALIHVRYARRPTVDPRYSLTNPSALLALQERQRGVLRLLAGVGFVDLGAVEVIEVGSGSGDNLLDLLRFGCAPERLLGIELLPQRSELARRRLPTDVRLVQGDASTAAVVPESVDLVLAFTVFSSLLDDNFQQRLADQIWRWIKPGGGVLWYDFTYNNPGNADVRAVPMRRVRELFTSGDITSHRITLAPPLARRVCRIHPALYGALNSIPWLRTHRLCWIQKNS